MNPSKIGWTDYSGGIFNIVLRGKHDCECSPGCEHCYMIDLDRRFNILPETTTYYPDKLKKWETVKLPQYSPKRGAPNRPMVFVVDGGDLFHPAVPADFIVSAFEVMSYRKDVDWIVLTKRPERMVSVLFGEEGNWYLGGGDFYDHILIGVTAENQARADERIPILLQNWAGPKWVSVEPQLEYVDLFAHISQLSWIVNGGESGPNRRPFNAQWAVNLYHQCLAANVRYFFKQGSATFPGQDDLLPGYSRVIHEFPQSRG